MSGKHRSSRPARKENPIVRGLIVSVLTAAVLLLVYSLLISRGTLTADRAVIGVTAIDFLSALTGGTAAAGKGDGGFKRAGISCGIFAAFIIVLALTVDAGLVRAASVVRILLCSLAGAVLGTVLHLGKSNKKYRKKHRT